jgi:hypothetical protein
LLGTNSFLPQLDKKILRIPQDFYGEEGWKVDYLALCILFWMATTNQPISTVRISQINNEPFEPQLKDVLMIKMIRKMPGIKVEIGEEECFCIKNLALE